MIDSDPESAYAIQVNGSFTWETVGKVDAKFAGAKGKGARKKASRKAKVGDDTGREGGGSKTTWWSRKRNGGGLPAPVTSKSPQPSGSTTPIKIESEKGAEEKPFTLDDLSLRIPKGQFVAIVGRVGSGKSSLLQSLVGEMRRTGGEVSD